MKKLLLRALSMLGLLFTFVLLFLYGSLHKIYSGNYPNTRDILSLSLLETSAAKFVPSLFLSSQELEDIIARNTVLSTDSTSDTSLVDTLHLGVEDIQLVEVSGSTYKGRMLLISDPSRVYLATPDSGFGSNKSGLTVAEYIERDSAIAGINGGGFSDKNGRGNGGTPTGYVIQNGELVYGSLEDVHCVTGFDANHKLIVGEMSAQEALDLGIVEGLCFSISGVGPLIVNGEPIPIDGTGGGLNPRTAIGQRADGTVILLNIDGRQSHSVGASYWDIVEIFLAQDVVNASNLDGGSSAMMIYENEVQGVSSSLVGVRQLPTAFLVK